MPIDQLTYNYSSTNPNQLQSVSDASGSSVDFVGGTGNYTYDNNGNLMYDPYKGLTFGNYNVLNRTDKITLSAGNYITYTYDAGGSLIRKIQYSGGLTNTQTDYIDGFVYLTVSGTTTLSYFPMPEGRVLNNGGGTYKQEFVITDQQGNARLSFQDNGSGIAVVKQETSYYGFGMQLPMSPVGLPTPPNKQLYNGGSEWQNDYSNLPDYYQTFNRNYDAALGRWIAVDPVAESAESMTGYQYAGNNPIMMNDPMGDLIKNAPAPSYVTQPPQIVSNLMPNTGPLDPNWQDGANFGGPPPVFVDGDGVGSGDGGGLYYTDQTAYWNLYNATGGAFGGTGIYHAGDASGYDPHSGVSTSSLASNIAYYQQNGIPDQVAGTVNLQEVHISAWNQLVPAIQAEAYAYNAKGGDPPLTRAQELARYGNVVSGFIVSGTLSLGVGGTIVFGTVETNKNYVQNFYTIYYTSTAAAGVGTGGFIVTNKGNKQTAISDWAGPVFGGTVSYGDYMGEYGTSSTYNSWRGGIGAGLSFKL